METYETIAEKLRKEKDSLTDLLYKNNCNCKENHTKECILNLMNLSFEAGFLANNELRICGECKEFIGSERYCLSHFSCWEKTAKTMAPKLKEQIKNQQKIIKTKEKKLARIASILEIGEFYEGI